MIVGSKWRHLKGEGLRVMDQTLMNGGVGRAGRVYLKTNCCNTTAYRQPLGTCDVAVQFTQPFTWD